MARKYFSDEGFYEGEPRDDERFHSPMLDSPADPAAVAQSRAASARWALESGLAETPAEAALMFGVSEAAVTRGLDAETGGATQ